MTENEFEPMPICMTIAGVDPSGGAGVLVDVRTFAAFGCYPAAAMSSLTFQNTTGVFGVSNQDRETLRQQIRPVLDDLDVAAVKTGMLPTAETIDETASLLVEYGIDKIVVDPVVRSTSGFDLIDDEALRTLVEKLFPLATIVTPNMQEAERIAGFAIKTFGDIEKAAGIMLGFGAKSVLVKGGHMPDGVVETGIARDHLFIGDRLEVIDGRLYDTTSTHGTGCTLAAAITANLALGKDLVEAVRISKRYVNEAIRTAPKIGKGHSPINIVPVGKLLGDG